MTSIWDNIAGRAEHAEVIYSYTRAQAIEDGVLHDLCDRTTIPGLFTADVCAQHTKVSVAMTDGLVAHLTPLVEDKRNGNDWAGIVHDIFSILRAHARSTSDDTLVLPVCITTEGHPQLHHIKAVIGPADDLKPCLTFMLPNED